MMQLGGGDGGKEGGRAETDETGPVALDRRKKLLKKLLGQQRSAAGTGNKLAEGQSEFALARPQDVIWWIRHDEAAVDDGTVSPQSQKGATAASVAGSNRVPQRESERIDDKGQDADDWLLTSLEVFLVTEGSSEPASELETRVRSIIESSSSDDIVQNDLLELLGFSDAALELISRIIQRRGRLKSKRKQQKKQASGPGKVASAPKRPLGSGIGREAGTDRVFIKGAKIGGGFLNDSAKYSLPPGTTRAWSELRKIDAPGTVTARYEKVFVPAPNRPPPSVSGSDAIPTTRFGPLSQKAFQGVPTLNRLQSRLFHAAYETSENLLVCAPTGAGKTNVAMTAIAREIDRLKNPKAVKVVYVAPMKALAQEVVDKFSERLASLKMQVRELTGDTQLSRGEIEKTQIVVTTPEKWDVITRKSGGDGTLGELVQLLIIDEVHLVGEDRGPVIEALVARTIRQVERRQQMVRIVGLSATLPNYVDVALFLRVNPDRGMFFFDSSFRPVPLEQTFVGVALPTSSQQQQTQQLPVQVDLFGNPVKLTEGNPAEEKQRQKSQLQKQRVLENAYNELACEYALESIDKGNQVMVFVHTRKDTSKTARALLEIAELKFHNHQAFGPVARDAVPQHNAFSQRVSKSKNQELQYLFARGMGIHHAGMAREDRSLTEEMFTKGAISVLCCTATLAWGVNLPAHTVIVKGTQIYAPERGGLCELNSADVFQCFGRAGRPQFDTSGEAILITEHAQLQRYLAMLTHSLPLESKLVPALPDALNAEIVSGTVSSLEEASAWLSYTFLYVRMLKSPTAYGVSLEERENDPHLEVQRMKLVGGAAKRLSEARMIRVGLVAANRNALGGYVPGTPLGVTDLGRVASHYYVHHETVESLFNETLRPVMTFQELFEAICSSKEFDQLKMRDEEIVEVKRLASKACPFEPLDPLDSATAQSSPKAKAFVLFQAFISRYPVDAFTLHSDMNYISQNAARIARALFEVAVARGWIHLALMTLKVCAALERRAWWWPMQHPLRQVAPVLVALESVAQLEIQQQLVPRKAEAFSVDALLGETPESLSEKILPLGIQRARKVISAVKSLPRCELHLVHRQPITSGLLRLVVRIVPCFTWRDRVHLESQSYQLFVDDGEWILHSERITISKSRYELHVVNQEDRDDSLDLTFTVPLFQQHNSRYFVRLESDSGWLDVGTKLEIDLHDLELPKEDSAGASLYTNLLDLDPISIVALKNKQLEETCTFTHFNPVQTQCFHVLFHRDESCIIGAPTGSGKTTLAELAMWRVLFSPNSANRTVVYVAPMKALVSERIADWKQKFSKWNKRVGELTGDASPSHQELLQCDLIVATPEKFDVVTRFWEQDDGHFLRRVRLVVLDEIHLLGEERGASLESLVARLKDVSRKQAFNKVRLLGLSTALANAKDLGEWFKHSPNQHVFVYNFRPAVRVVPLEVHVSGFPGAHYCPRMASMNKPVFHAIERYSRDKPALVFVASRRQTRLTAFDLISLCAHSDDPRRFLKADINIDELAVDDDALRHSLQFGIALHHAGLSKRDRSLSERLFASGACQVLIATATLAWGVNLPAHLVVVKGTEYFDASKRRYEPFPVTDVLQMMGRAGRPQFGDEKGVAVILVHDQLKSFYKRFLYEPFPVESNLISSGRLDAFVNAEVASRKRDMGNNNASFVAEYLKKETYLSIRVRQNPSFYGCRSSSAKDVDDFFHQLSDRVLKVLKDCQCVKAIDDGKGEQLQSTALGRIAARFDLKPRSALGMLEACKSFATSTLSIADGNEEEALRAWVVEAVARTCEFQDVPVRHKEDELNESLSMNLKNGLGPFKLAETGTAHCKAYLLIQAKLEGFASLPIHDYVTDSKQVLDIAARCIPALAEVACVAETDVRIVVAAVKIVARLDESGVKFASVRQVVAKREENVIKCSLSGEGRVWAMLVMGEGGKGADGKKYEIIKLERFSLSPNQPSVVRFTGLEQIPKGASLKVAVVSESNPGMHPIFVDVLGA